MSRHRHGYGSFITINARGRECRSLVGASGQQLLQLAINPSGQDLTNQRLISEAMQLGESLQVVDKTALEPNRDWMEVKRTV